METSSLVKALRLAQRNSANSRRPKGIVKWLQYWFAVLYIRQLNLFNKIGGINNANRNIKEHCGYSMMNKKSVR